ncbi:MBL fold metallo-hydrolase [Planococcus salinus]|uniref:MBL fold metallo-hydrolase n=1 Tax=Planococcus salinus TaxID=1848460 RepID=A0A3M8P3Q6_9BACL|nr:MBL fold metallo-hydrolase [Planococcus salinus]RNF38292.1 MBL fold metallo-hydrolase [Planococcus salinus]
MTVKSISPKEVADQVINREPVYVLDVRDNESSEDWQIEGSHVQLINIPFEQLKGSDPSQFTELPKDKPLYTVCAKGNTSQKAAELLADNGFGNVYSIEGGMAAWSEQLEPVKIGEVSGGAIYQFVRLGKGCLSYLIESDGKAAVVDANRMTEVYEQFAKEQGIVIEQVLDTHLHADHISGGKKLAEASDAVYHLPPQDAEEVIFDFEPITDGTKLSIGKATIEAVYSPGHTIGSTTFIVDGKYLLTGDILFVESIGRPDLAGKAGDWADDLYVTLYERYKELAGELLVLPAHYADPSEMNEDGSVSEKLNVLYEKNEGLQIKDENQFIKRVTEDLKEQPNAYEEIRQTNMGRLKPEPEKAKEMETGPNNCAV